MAKSAASYPCLKGSCNKRYATSNSLNRHVRDKHQGVSAVVCSTCNRILADKYVLDKHIKRAHPDLVPAAASLPALAQPAMQGHGVNDEGISPVGGAGSGGGMGNGQFEKFLGRKAEDSNIFGAGQFDQGGGRNLLPGMEMYDPELFTAAAGWNGEGVGGYDFAGGGYGGGGEGGNFSAVLGLEGGDGGLTLELGPATGVGVEQVGGGLSGGEDVGESYVDLLRRDVSDGGTNFLAGMEGYDTGVYMAASDESGQ